MRPIEIRPAEPGDVEALASLSLQLGYPVSEADVRAHLERGPSGEHRSLLVAVREGQVHGWVELATRSALESGAWAEITGLVVDEAARGAGIGSQLVAAARAWTRERGLARLRVRTNATRERTARFYERAGFELVKQQRVYDVAP
jgi:GNAT superfamily N-acetyltransferase